MYNNFEQIFEKYIWHNNPNDLPSDGERVLVVKKPHNKSNSYFYDIDYYDSTYGMWFCSGRNVIAWMPLPEFKGVD